MLTIGINREGCLEVARRNLARFPFVTVVEGRTQHVLPQYVTAMTPESTAFFLDGPKAGDAAFGQVLAQILRVKELCFLAIDDCQRHIPPGFDPYGRFTRGFLNLHRTKLIRLYEFFPHERYALGLMSNQFSERYACLNQPIYAVRSSIRPYYFRQSQQLSHSFEIGVVYRRPDPVPSVPLVKDLMVPTGIGPCGS